MFRIILLSAALFFTAIKAHANASDFAKYFKVDMQITLPDTDQYRQKMYHNSQYDKGYVSRFDMGRQFKREFTRVIKAYGMSEGRIKADYEDDLVELLHWLPKESYPYIGPMLHEVPGMPEKILNMPGIKETKNQFPQDIADRFIGIEGIEYLSPELYFLLMPDIWNPEQTLDPEKPLPIRAKKPRVNVDLPNALKLNVPTPQPTASKQSLTTPKLSPAVKSSQNLRTLSPSLTSRLTAKDVQAFISTIDDVINWGMQDEMQNYAQLLEGEAVLNYWEKEQQTALAQNDLKDMVNPCQRLVLKTRFSNQYSDFAKVVAKQGFTPEEWAYTCDKTIKSYRVGVANMAQAYAIRFHRRGYYDQYTERLPAKWRDHMYATEEALIRMYTALREDVETVRPYQKELTQKFIKMRGVMLTAPIIY